MLTTTVILTNTMFVLCLLGDLATVVRNTITTAITPDYRLTVVTRPTPLQQKAFNLLGVNCSQ